jgi:Na+/phosphate symporter
MSTEEDVFELKAKHKLLETKMQAMVNLLAREGMLSKSEIEEEVERIVQLEDQKHQSHLRRLMPLTWQRHLLILMCASLNPALPTTALSLKRI